MIRRARLSVKPNVRPGVGARAAGAAVLPRGREPRRPPEPAEPPEVPEPPEAPAAEPPEKAPERSDEKIDGGNDVEESSQPPPVPQRRKRVSGTSSVLKADVTAPSECPPVSTASEDAAQPKPVPAKEKAPCSDRYRIYKAQKLREMLKEELRKEKKQWKNKCAVTECQKPLDRSKMTMRDFIYYLPESNPMTSSLEQEKKTEKVLPSVQTREQENKNTADADGSEEVEEETDEGPLLVPRVKVAEDGSIILDEESLTVEVLRTKGPCVVEENDPIFERGSTTTYSSFRKSCYSKPWSNKETDMFFLAISMVGTDFSMIGQLFPHRARTEIKNKFKREERTNGWRIDKAFQEKRPFDFDFFAHLLQKVLAEEEKRKQKSVKNHSVKEKEASKSTKHGKAKKVASGDVIDGAEESVSAVGVAGSPKGAQAAAEETASSGQASEQAVSGQEISQKKRRRKTKDETNNKEVKSPSENAMVQSGLSKGEKRKSKSLSLEPAETEAVCGEKQESSCVQSVDASICPVSGQEAPEDPDASLPSSGHPGALPAAGQPSGFPSSGVEASAVCAPNDAEAGCAEETDVGTKSESANTEQTENVKPGVRGRLQRPKPSLSRALGKKAVLPQAETGAERKSSPSETSVDTSHVEKATMPMCDGDGMERPESESLLAEPASRLDEKACLQEASAPKALKPARLTRGRLQRPKPNVANVPERKPQTSQENLGAAAEETQAAPCVDGGISQQVEDQSRESVECGDVTSGPERKDGSGEIPSDEPKAGSASPSVQENNETNILKQVPSQRTRFQKAKPNIVRGAARRGICSNKVVPEEILVSEDMTVSLRETVRPDSLPSGEVPVEVSAAKELELHTGEAGGSIISPREKMPEVDDVIVEMEVHSEMTAGETSLREEVSEGAGTAVRDAHTGDGPPQEDTPEELTVTVDTEADLKRIEREGPPSEMLPEMTDAMEETEEFLERTELSTQTKAPEGITATGDMETDPEGVGEVSQRENVLLEASEEMEFHLEENGKKDIPLSEEVPGGLTAAQHAGATWERTGGAGPLEERPSEDMVVPEGAGEEKPEETSPAGEAELDSLRSSSADRRATVPPPGPESAGSEGLSEMCSMAAEENRSSGKEGSSHFPDLETRSQISADVTEKDKRELHPPDAVKQFSDATLSISLPQEQKPLEVKPASFVRSRFKRPKPNLARAVLKREAAEAAKCVPGEGSETGTAEAGAAPRDGQQARSPPCQHAVASLMTSKEKDASARLPWSEPAKGLALPASSEPAESAQSAEIQPHDAITSSGIQSKNAIQQETKESVTQTVQPIRGRLQRPRPNLRKAAQREIQKGEARSAIQQETAVLKNDEANEKSLCVANSQIGAEIEAVSCKVSECRIYENEGHDVVLPENVQVNQINILAEEMRHENKLYVPSPEQLIKEKFPTTQPDLGAAQCEKEEPEVEKDTTEQREASSPEDGAQQPGAQQPGAQQLGAQQLGAQQPGAQQSGAQQPGAQQPGAQQLGAQQLGAQQPGTQQPCAQQLGVQQPGTQQPCAQQPGSQQLGDQQLGAQQPCAQQLGAQQLGAQQLGAQQPCAQQPCVQQPCVQQLGAQQLGAQQPGTQQPCAQQLGAQQPCAQQLGAQQLGAQQLGAQQLGAADHRLLPKEKAEFLTSLEVCTRKDDTSAAQSSVAERDTRLGAGGDGCPHPVAESQPLRTPASCPQLTNESDHCKTASDRTLAVSSGSESKMGHNKRRMQRNIKPNVSRGRGCKRIRGRTSKREPKTSRSTLVTLRAGHEEEEDDAEDFDFTEEEPCHLAPEEVNKAPVFVPLGLRSPEPVSAQIEETMEEFEITVNVPDMECIVVVEPQLPNTDVTAQEMKQEENGNASSVEVTSSVHTQDEPATNDGSAEAAIALLTMGDLVLQSEIGAEQGDGVCVLADAHLEDKSHAPFSPDDVNVGVVAECRGLASPVTSTALESLEENKIVLEEQSTREEVGLVEKVKGTATPTRSAVSKMTSNLRMRSRFARPKPNLKQASRTNRLLKEDASLCVTQEVVTESQIETEESASETAEVEARSLGPVTVAGREQQSRVECACAGSETGVAQEAHVAERNAEEEEGSEVVLVPPVAPLVSSLEPAVPMLALSQISGEGLLRQESAGGGVLTLQVPQQCTPANVAEVHQGNVISSQDLTGLMAADIRQEDEQAFILTLVEIPTSAAAEFTDTTAQSVPASLLPAPILVKSASSEERADGSVNLPVASLHQGAMCLPVSGRDGSEKSPANLDLTTRKRFHCSLEESDQAPPAKKSSLTSRILHQEYASGVCSTELINVLDETGESCKGRAGSPSLGSSVHPDPAKEHLESACQSLAPGTVNEITSPHGEKSVPQCARVEVTQEERTDAACASPWMEDKMPATKPPLSRPHRKPLGFLSLICSKKTSLGSDEPAQVHRKKRLKPLIPAARQSVKRSDPPSEIQETSQESCDALPALSISAGAQHRETRQEPCDALPAPSVSAGAQHQETRQEPCDALPAPSLNARAQHRETRQEPCDALPAPSIYTGAQHQETRRELCDTFPAPSVYTGAQHQETRQEPHDALPALSVYTGAQHQETRQESCDTLLAPNANVGSQPQETRQELRDALPSPSVDASGQPQETRQESWDALPAPSVDAESQPQETRWESRDTLPAPNADAGSQPENPGESAAQVQVSCDEAPRRGECQSGQHAAPAEEPTTVSEYFFNDIFIEVDEAE